MPLRVEKAVALVTAITGSQRWGMASVLPFLVIGGHSNKFPQEGERENIRQAKRSSKGSSPR